MNNLIVQYFKSSKIIYAIWIAGYTNYPNNPFCHNKVVSVDEFTKRHPAYSESINNCIRSIKDSKITNTIPTNCIKVEHNVNGERFLLA
jgi:hypothetical protein